MGITLAIGVITVFDEYRDDVASTTEKEEALYTASKIENAIFQLKTSSSGYKDVELPKTLGGSDYTVALTGEVKILTSKNSYSREIGMPGNFSGSVKGGEARLYKNQNNYVLREG